MAAEKLKNARKQLNLTAKEMAAKLETPVRTYEGWELGKKMPPVAWVVIRSLIAEPPKKN